MMQATQSLLDTVKCSDIKQAKKPAGSEEQELKLECVSADDSVASALAQFGNSHVVSAPVLGAKAEGQQVKGVLNALDLVVFCTKPLFEKYSVQGLLPQVRLLGVCDRGFHVLMRHCRCGRTRS